MVKFKRFSNSAYSLSVRFLYCFCIDDILYFRNSWIGSDLKSELHEEKGWNRKRCQVLDIIGALSGSLSVSMFVFFMLLFVSWEVRETSEMEWGCAFPLPAAHDTTPSARYWVKRSAYHYFFLQLPYTFNSYTLNLNIQHSYSDGTIILF